MHSFSYRKCVRLFQNSLQHFSVKAPLAYPPGLIVHLFVRSFTAFIGSFIRSSISPFNELRFIHSTRPCVSNMLHNITDKIQRIVHWSFIRRSYAWVLMNSLNWSTFILFRPNRSLHFELCKKGDFFLSLFHLNFISSIFSLHLYSF